MYNRMIDYLVGLVPINFKFYIEKIICRKFNTIINGFDIVIIYLNYIYIYYTYL